MRAHAPGKFAWMNGSRLNRLLLPLVPGCLFLFAHPSFGQVCNPSQPVTSQWVYYDAQHRLRYTTLPSGDRIMDFSTAGYEQGAAPIPEAPVMVTLGPSGRDDTQRIQKAITRVSKLHMGSNGLRGAVLLLPGAYSVSGSLSIQASGVVLRGSGSKSSPESNTVITMIPATLPSKPYPLFVLGSQFVPRTQNRNKPTMKGEVHYITGSYIRSGSNTLRLGSVAGLAVGDTVIITRPVTTEWVGLMGMNDSDCSGSSCGDPVPAGQYCWIKPGCDRLQTDRTIANIIGNKITLDAPMSDSFDSTFDRGLDKATLQRYAFTKRIHHVAVEHLRAVAPQPDNALVPPTATYQLAVSYAVKDAWMRDLAAVDTLQSVVIGDYSKQVTVKNIDIAHTITQTDNAMFMEFYISGATQVLMEDLTDIADHTLFFSTSEETQGPNVLRNGFFLGDDRIEPHQRWATGLLIENTVITHHSASTNKNTINLCNRGAYGTFHGWAVGWGVVWNSCADQFIIQMPPGSQNWCIGCTGVQEQAGEPQPGGGEGPMLPQGAIDAPYMTVTPRSLYEAQLANRLGRSLSCQ
jgi:hypothetical protein